MPYIQTTNPYDVCIVGSGAGGGMAAYVLANADARIVMLEAGPTWDAAVDGAMLAWNYDSPRRGAPTPTKPFGEFDGCIGGWDIEGEPYTLDQGTDWRWFRARMLGGRTNHWGRISLRFGPDDFRRRSIDGLGDDWPIGYGDIEPFYDRVDRLVGVFGSREGLPNEPDGVFLPPPAPRCYESLIMEAGRGLGMPVIPSRLSILTESMPGRAACHYCGQCGRGCSTKSNFSSPSVLLGPALETGNLEIRTGAMAREVLIRKDGSARGVSYVDTATGQEEEVLARTVVIAASACESARLMLNSRSSHHPDGIGNSSGLVGRYLMDSTGADAMGFVPALAGMPAHNEDGVGGAHIYVPWWLNRDRSLDFARGYHIETWGGRQMPSYGFMGGIHRYNGRWNSSGAPRSRGGGGYGLDLKNDYRHLYGATVGFSGRGEMVARYENYCEIDPNVVDRFGIPVLRFHVEWSDQEVAQIRHFQETAYQLLHAMGAEPLWAMPGPDTSYGITAPGQIIHEVGTARMGNDPDHSVVDAWCRLHDVPNVYVADAASFVSQADKNPTWTILALAMRTSEHIAEQARTLSARNHG